MEIHTGTPLLLGHFYTRYLADLFGGSMLGHPSKLALGLSEVPHFYVHPPAVGANRREVVESVYESLNDAGRDLSSAQQQAVVAEAAHAFELNAALYKEGTGGAGAGMYAGAAAGGLRVLAGYAVDRLRGSGLDVFGRPARV